MLITPSSADPQTEEELRKIRYTAEERARLRRAGPFALDEWMASGPPATPAQLEEMEELLRLREREREASLARDAGVLP